MTTNIYEKLDEAQQLYLNPTIELLEKYQAKDLKDHCFYRLKKYPNLKDPLWQHIELHNWEEIGKLLQEKTEKKLASNLQMAIDKKDSDYLDFLMLHQPKRKFVLSLSRKKALIDQDLADQMDIKDRNNLTIFELKKRINSYIFDKRLQDGQMIKMNSVLARLLEINETTLEMHLFDVQRQFKKKYLN